MIDFNKMFSVESAKAAKALGFGWMNGIHYMAPADVAGIGNLCVFSTKWCRDLCLGMYSGQAAMVSDIEKDMNAVRNSRIEKARMFMQDRCTYMNHMARQVFRLYFKAIRAGMHLCIRPNGSTDIPFERIKFEIDAKTAALLGRQKGEYVTLIGLFPDIQFVDYTKDFGRLGKAPANLHLTLSFSGENHEECKAALAAGHNVAVIFRGKLPETYWGYRVINGDKHDLRHLDPKGGVIVGLTPKGRKAKKAETPFIIDVA